MDVRRRDRGIGRFNVPEFIDLFPDGLPIIYMRARVGNPGISDAGTDLAQYDANHNDPVHWSAQFDLYRRERLLTTDAYLQNPAS